VPVLSSIILLLSAFNSQALTPKTTRNVINGSAPYLTFDGGRTRVTNTDELLAITLPSGTRITPITNTSSETNPIQLQVDNVRFSDIITSVLVDGNSIVNTVALDTLIGPPNNYWGDDDGDGQGSGGISATGTLSSTIIDKNRVLITGNEILDPCKGPYSITLSSTAGTLSTRYGFPKHRDFRAGSATYYINPKAGSPKVCLVRPSLLYGTFGADRTVPHADFRGPSDVWIPDRGFLPQSTDPAHYDLNFPTTGIDGLEFDLYIAGVYASKLSWPPVTHSGITFTMKPERFGSKVHVTVTGPVATSAQRSSDSPGNIPRPALPVTFELVGRDSSGRDVIKYGFKLKQWFVNRGNEKETAANQAAWCNNIGYQVPRVRDLTNAVRTGRYPISGATPSSSSNNYQRNINAGFFTEWGLMYVYHSSFFPYDYWTSDVAVGNSYFAVNSFSGGIGNGGASYLFAVCVSSLRP
jgi:hypothetical protein